jgi:hypothetical protein
LKIEKFSTAGAVLSLLCTELLVEGKCDTGERREREEIE